MFKRKEKEVSEESVYKTLPHNRKELFFDLLLHRKMTLFALSSLTFCFFIPLAVDLFYFNYLEAVAIANDKLDYLFSLVFYSMLIMIPCMVVGFIGLAGAFYAVKKIVWQEGVIFSVDFFNGIKENWKHALINGVIFATLLFGLVVGGSYLLIFSKDNPVLCGVGIGALIVLFIFFGISIALFFTQDVYYENPYITTMRNAFRFLGLTNWKTFLLFVLSTGSLIALSALNFITLAIGLFLFAILNSVIIVLYTLISHSAFDKYINKVHYPEMVNKGLYKEEIITNNNEEVVTNGEEA